MKVLTAPLCLFGALLLLTPSASYSQLPPVRERLGLRTGYIHTLDRLDDTFGGGGHLTLHFTERVYNHLYFDFRVGAVYLGDSKIPELARDLFGNDDIVTEMRILYFSVGPNYTFDLAEYWTGYVSAGGGIYSVSILFDTGIQAGDTSDQHPGFNAGGGVLWRFTDTWNLDLNVTVHHFLTKQERRDLLWLYTGEGASDPYLLQFATGLSIDLH
jgi:opacity protein-like surface antigen